VERDRRIAVVSPTRNLDGFDNEEVIEDMKEIVEVLRDPELRTERYIVVDLCHLEFCSSTSLSLLTVLWKRVTAVDGVMLLCNASNSFTELIRMLHFDVIWKVFSSREAAIEEAISAMEK
jgi:anti-anti-sigma factor